ncbi:MAG: fibronectin type III domain-containing protein [Clostridia bacterium]|nr:fibronectin type III domain-containing protein [Clostridia bacterium]
MKKMRFISLILALILVFTTTIPAAADGTHAAKSAVEVFDGDVIQDQFTEGHTFGNYVITATETKYYKFTFDNQSVEARTGISIADSFINLFFGKINIQILDSAETIKADFSVRCGYSGNVSLKLTQGSTYRIKVTTDLYGYYRMRVNSYTDIGGDTWETATETLSVGQMISSIDAPGDKDWYYFETDDTDSFYNFNLENISGLSNLYMYVYEYVEGAGERPLRDTFNMYASHSYTTNHQLKLKPNSKYYVCIYLNSGIGGYQLDIVQTLDAVGDTMDNAYKVEPDTKVTTALDGKGDVDYFKFTTKDYNAYYYLDMGNLSINNDYSLYVYDAAGNEIGYGKHYGSYGVHINFKLDPNTEYYFKIYAHNNATGNYNFTISDIADAHANERENATQIQLDQEISAAVSGANDVDFFKFTTQAFEAYYYFDMENLSIGNDYSLYVYDAAGNEIGYGKHYGSYGIHINFKLDPNTEYYFKIYAHNGATGNYKVKVTSQRDNYPNKQEKAIKISLNQEISEAINGNGDVDFFKFTTQAFEAYYYFDMENLSIGNDYSLYVYDAAGNEIGHDRYYGSKGIHINFKLDPNTEYYFKIYAHNGATGNYKVKVSYIADTEGNTKDKAASISINKPLTRELSSNNDVDWFKFTLNYDANIRFLLINESGNSKDIYVYSAIEKQLVYSYASSSTQQTAILDAGEYYIKIKGSKGYYTIAVGDCGSAHIEGYRYVKATDKADGIKTTYCKSCQAVIKKEVIPRINKVSLSYAKTTYSGSAKKPSVTVYDINGDKIPSSQYTVKYPSGRVNVGTYSVTVTFKGKYTGAKTVKFQIVAQSSAKLKATLSASSYHYNGKSKKPTVTVKNSAGKKISSSYYKVTYPTNSKKVGTYKVKITFKGNYTGTKYVYFKVNPAKSAVTKLTAGSKKLTVKLAKSTSGSGYQVQYSTSKSFKSKKTKTVKSNKITTVTLKGLKAKKTYYVRVRSFKKVSGKTYYSAWSYVKYKKTKK